MTTTTTTTTMKTKTKKKTNKLHYYTMRPIIAGARYCQNTGRTLSVALCTSILLNDIFYAYSVQQNLIIIIEGHGGSGKSEIAQSIAKMWTELTGGTIHVIFDVDEVPQAGHGDFIILDEWIVPEGAGKQIAINRLWNMISTVRASMVSFAICSPSVPNVRFCHYYLETYSQDWINRKNLAIIRVPIRNQLIEIGKAEFSLHDDEAFRQEYEKRKLERVDKILEKKGKKTIDFADTTQIAEIALSIMKERGLVPRTLSETKAIVSMLAKENGWDLHYEAKNEVSALIRVLQRQEEEEYRKEEEAEIMISGEGWDVFRVQLGDLLLKLGAEKKYADAIAGYFVPLYHPSPRYKDVCEQFNLGVLGESFGYQVRKYKKRIKTKELGDIGEKTVASWIDSSLSGDGEDGGGVGGIVGGGGGDGGGGGEGLWRRVKVGKGVGDVDVWMIEEGIAINVKTTLEDHFREQIPTTPEYEYRPKAVLVLLMPRILEVRLFRIVSEKQTINRVRGILCTPKQLADRIIELVA